MGAWVASRCIGFRRTALAAMAVAVVFLAPAARAGNADQGARAVRLGYVDGTVQLVQDNQVLADQAVANTPLFEGTLVATAGDGRAEIQFEDGSLARIAPNSSLLLSVLRGKGGAAQTEITLQGGLGYFELQAAANSGQMRIRFGDTVVTAQAFTVMRIDLDTLPGSLAVFTGNAHMERGSALTLDLHEGQSVTLDASDASRYTLAETIPQDSWDAWNSDRDQALQAEYADRTGATSSQSDSSNPAWADLDANGNWYNVPGQGYVWSPYDASSSDWDPYGNGYWMWTPSYDYIWVSGYNWGYLPYSCGAWNFYNSFGWGWMPGGCSPWWGGGGWGANIGQGPGGYRTPHRPRVNPPRGFPRDTHVGINHRPLPPHPIVPVSRHLSGLGGGLPARNGNTPVVIAGHPVPPVRPLAPRAVYGGALAGAGNHTRPAFPYGARSPQGVRPSGGSGLTSSSPGSTSFTSGGGSTSRSFGFRSDSSPNPPSNTLAPSRPSPGGGSWFRPSAPGGSGGSKPSSGGGGWFHRGNSSSGGSHSWGSRNSGGSSHSDGGSGNSGGGSRNSGGSGAHVGGGGGSHGGGSHR